MKTLRYCLNVLGVVVVVAALWALLTVIVALAVGLYFKGQTPWWWPVQLLPGLIVGLWCGRAQWRVAVSKTHAPETLDAVLKRVWAMRYAPMAYHAGLAVVLAGMGLMLCRHVWQEFSALEAREVKQVEEWWPVVEAYKVLGPKGAVGTMGAVFVLGMLGQVGCILKERNKLRAKDAARPM